MLRIHPLFSRKPCQLEVVTGQWIQLRHNRIAARAKHASENWTEKLRIDKKYPLTIALQEAVQPTPEPRPKAKLYTSKEAASRWKSVHVRPQIVNPGLCDDVIKYIGHKLERHKGCDILDINPGAGLWSQKLHEFLQPRSHVLLEPGYKKFQSFLDPLLTAPNSKYVLSVKDPCDTDTYRAMFDEGLFPYQNLCDPQESKARQVNDTLLVTGSLVWDPRLPGLGFDSMAKQLFHHFAAAAPTNDLLHIYGLARTLFWVQHDDFSPMIAESISGMQKANRALEMTHNITVVVRAEHAHRKIGKASLGREPQFEIESVVRAMKTGREKGIELLPLRRDHVHDIADDIEEVTKGSGITRSFFIQDYLRSRQLAGKSTLGLLQESFLEHYEQECNLRSEFPELNWEQVSISPTMKTSPKWKLKGHAAKERISQFVRKRSNVHNIIGVKAEVERVADIGEDIYHLECKILDTEDGLQREKLMKRLEDLGEEWKSSFESIAMNYTTATLTEVDDRLAIRSLPFPRLQWDRRPFEPLVMSSSEVWPHNRLSLILSEPIPRLPSQSADWAEWVQDFIFGLYAQPGVPINQALDRMQHGLSDIMKDCPTLKKPKEGGRLQMQHLRVRLLTGKMIEELVTAYKKWPFKAPGSDHNKYFRHKGATQGYSYKL